MSDLLYWHESWSAAKPLDEAVEYMRDSIETDGDSPQYADEVRLPEFDDVPDLFEDVLTFLDERLYESDTLGYDDGGPTLTEDKSSEQAEGLRSALIEYLRRNVDLREAAYQPTGRTLRLTPDGYHIEEKEACDV